MLNCIRNICGNTVRQPPPRIDDETQCDGLFVAFVARPFPNRHYHNGRLGTDLSLGVDNWPYEGMKLKKLRNQRDSQTVLRFKEDLSLHGVDLDQQAPGTDVDHVIDLVFETGIDSAENLWPLDSAINRNAGGKWIFGTYLVTWADTKGGPPMNTTPADVPTGRWFVIVDERKPSAR